MSARITADDVEWLGPKPPFHGAPVSARVHGSTRDYVVDRFEEGGWFCTCRIPTAHPARECTHIRATKEALR